MKRLSHQPIDNPHEHDPLRPHAHDPNPEPPSLDPAFVFIDPAGQVGEVTVAQLEQLPQLSLTNCYIVSTGHGASGPFTFTGVRLLDLIESRLAGGVGWSQVEVVSADGFGNRVTREELWQPDPAGPVLLSTRLNGQRMSREQGLVRLIVPSEKDDALRQVKWVGSVRVL
jgi:hypothetical protein